MNIIDNFWILQNVEPDFIDTDNCPLLMCPVSFLLSFCLLGFIRSNTFGIVKKYCTPDQATMIICVHYAVVIFFSIFPTNLQQYLHVPPDPLKLFIFCIDLHAVNFLILHGEIYHRHTSKAEYAF